MMDGNMIILDQSSQEGSQQNENFSNIELMKEAGGGSFDSKNVNSKSKLL